MPRYIDADKILKFPIREVGHARISDDYIPHS